MDKLLKSQDYLSNSGVDIEKPKEDKAKNEKNQNRADKLNSSRRHSSRSSSYKNYSRRNKHRNRRDRLSSGSSSRSRSKSFKRRSPRNKKYKPYEKKRKYSYSSSSSSFSGVKKNKDKHNIKDNQDSGRNYNARSKYSEGYKADDVKSLADSKNLEEKNKPPIIKEKPNFEPTGILARETNTINGVELKFTEPLDSAEPSEEWRLYSFKDNDVQDVLQIDQQSFYLVGKDERVCNIIVNHPSCSRQHAVIQYRKTEGTINTNGTFIDKEKIESSRYYELVNYDLINFGNSTRDYILIKGDNIDYNRLKH